MTLLLQLQARDRLVAPRMDEKFPKTSVSHLFKNLQFPSLTVSNLFWHALHRMSTFIQFG